MPKRRNLPGLGGAFDKQNQLKTVGEQTNLNQKPERARQYIPPKPYARESNTKPIYGQRETSRYKSMWLRYLNALQLVRFEQIINVYNLQDPNPQVTQYRFLSNRSNVGYWTVTVNTAAPPGGGDA